MKFWILQASFEVLECNATRVRTEDRMSTCQGVDQRRAKPGSPTETEHRLPVGQSVVVIAGLSLLSWAVLIAIVMGLRALL
jgi:hypothetical protein